MTNNPDGLSDARAHLARMIEAAANYIEPTTYIARHPDTTSIGDCKFVREFPEPNEQQSEAGKAATRQRRDQAFIRDMIYMLDGPQQREAMATPPASTSTAIAAGDVIAPVELRALSDRATPGPWAWEQCGEKEDVPVIGIAFPSDDTDCKTPYEGEFRESDASRMTIAYDWQACDGHSPSANAALAVAAVNYVRAMLAAAPKAASEDGAAGLLREILLICEEAAYACASCSKNCGPVKALNEVYELITAALAASPTDATGAGVMREVIESCLDIWDELRGQTDILSTPIGADVCFAKLRQLYRNLPVAGETL